MKLRLLPFGVLLVVVAAGAATDPAGTDAPADPAAKRVVPNGRLPEARRQDRPNKYGKPVIPDPDLLDGSSFEKEKRPLHGIISEIEIGENEGGKQDKISPNSGPAGAQQEDPSQKTGSMAAAAPPKPQATGDDQDKVPQGPEAKPEGAQAANLKVPEGAAGAAGGPEQGKPRDMQIGDATLQIQTAAQKPDVVGTQASNSQQYEKKVPPGGSTIPSSGNSGVEKGRVVPKGL